MSLAYARDDLGRIAEKTEIALGVTKTFAYSYNNLGRLTQVTEDGVVTEVDTYDANGNRTASTNSSGTFTATFDDQDRMMSYGGYTYTYGANGELALKVSSTMGTTAYAYDALGNLLKVVLPSGDVVDYLVDAAGRRIGKTVNGVLTQAWIWRSRLQPVAEVDASDAVLKRFVYAGGGNVPVYMTMATGSYRLIMDHLGSVRLVVDAVTGAVAQELEYDAWGRVVVDTNPGFQPFSAGLSGGLNLYGYSGNDPHNRIDSTGLDDWSAGWASVGGQVTGLINAGAAAAPAATAVVGGFLGAEAVAIAGGGVGLVALLGLGASDFIGTFGGPASAGPAPEIFPPMDEGLRIRDDEPWGGPEGGPECGPRESPYRKPAPPVPQAPPPPPPPPDCAQADLVCGLSCGHLPSFLFAVCHANCRVGDGC